VSITAAAAVSAGGCSGAYPLQGSFDVYNVLNASSILAENTTYGPSWRRPTAVLDARLFKFGGQLTF
jgi:hypothetical protein